MLPAIAQHNQAELARASELEEKKKKLKVSYVMGDAG